MLSPFPIYAHMTHTKAVSLAKCDGVLSASSKSSPPQQPHRRVVVTCQCKSSCIVAGAFIRPRSACGRAPFGPEATTADTLIPIRLQTHSQMALSARGCALTHRRVRYACVHLHANGRRSALAAKSPCRRDASNAD